ncbi:MAG: restriction endonuclease [Dehalococcoidia bacterium]|nr:restriction endonuclease [Dehalococcoidia bacterium]
MASYINFGYRAANTPHSCLAKEMDTNWQHRDTISPLTQEAQGDTPLDQFKKRLMDGGWREFEIYIKDLFQKMGFQAIATQPTKDGGIDVTAYKFDELGTKIDYIIQCKLYQDGNRVRERELRELWGMMQEKRSHGIMICTGGFTRDAKEFAKEPRSIACWGIEDLFSYHQKHW